MKTSLLGETASAGGLKVEGAAEPMRDLPASVHAPVRTLGIGNTGAPFTRAAMHVFHTVVNGNLGCHDHTFMEIALVTSGQGTHVSQSGTLPLATADVIVLRPGAWHAYVACENLGVFNCCVSMQFLSRDLAFASEQAALNQLFWVRPLAGNNRGVFSLHLGEQEKASCEEQLRRVVACNGNKSDPCSFVEGVGHLLIALSIIGRQIELVDGEASAQAAHPAVLACRALIEDRCEYEWTLDELAQKVHVAPEYLVRIFKRDSGISPIAFLMRCRAERAALLLLRSKKSIAEIGEEVGWSEPSYFARCFKKCYGMSASTYRERFG
ncbi:MAG: AraC family transcriptional regulator [Capsulimonadaceae bacterium]|nr:AraC family transcriptional regulator [Capsulimonadaceae bacterium]